MPEQPQRRYRETISQENNGPGRLERPLRPLQRGPVRPAAMLDPRTRAPGRYQPPVARAVPADDASYSPRPTMKKLAVAQIDQEELWRSARVDPEPLPADPQHGGRRHREQDRPPGRPEHELAESVERGPSPSRDPPGHAVRQQHHDQDPGTTGGPSERWPDHRVAERRRIA